MNVRVKRGIAAVFVVALATVGILLFLPDADDPRRQAPSEEGASGPRPSEEKTVAKRARNQAKLSEMRQVVKRMKAAKEHMRSDEPFSSGDAMPLRTSTLQERRVTRERIVLGSIRGMIDRGERDKAVIFLKEQRALFPEESADETEALDLIAGCIDQSLDTPAASARAFVDAHPGHRTNRYLLAICAGTPR